MGTIDPSIKGSQILPNGRGALSAYTNNTNGHRLVYGTNQTHCINVNIFHPYGKFSVIKKAITFDISGALFSIMTAAFYSLPLALPLAKGPEFNFLPHNPDF